MLPAILGAVKALVTDSNTEVRTAAAAAFWSLHGSFAGEASALLSRLPHAQQKSIGRAKPKA